MNLTANRGRLLFMIAVALLLLERLGMAGLALAGYGQPYFNWTSVVLPLTHIAVVLFLVYTSDLLIYWLVIMWGVITAGSYVFKLWDRWNTASVAQKAEWYGKMLPTWWPVVALIAFHIIITLLFLLPAVRGFLAEQRSKLEFEESHAAPLPTDETEKKKP